MSQYTNSGNRAFLSGETMGQYLRVKLSAGTVVKAGSTDPSVGVTSRAVLTSGDPVDVQLRTKQGTVQIVAAGAITAGNPVYAAASGKVDASGTVYEGIALSASTADGDVVEVMPAPNTDISTAITGTSASTFEVDNDATTPSIQLASQTGGTGDFKAIVKPPATLTADRTFTLPADSDQTLVGATATQTLTNKTLTAPVIGVATGTSLAVTAGLTSSGPTGAGIGYATGAGGTVSQGTDRTTGVTLSKLTGQITTQATSLAAAALVSFTVTNTTVAIGDTVVLSIQSGPTTVGTIAYVTAVANGSFQITLKNLHASTADTGAAIINFAVIKAVSA